jgi:hypothetical protein
MVKNAADQARFSGLAKELDYGAAERSEARPLSCDEGASPSETSQAP